MKQILFIIILTLLPAVTSAEEPADTVAGTKDSSLLPVRYTVGNPEQPHIEDSIRLENKSFWRAATETFGLNIGLWAFDRYIQKGHFAYISLETIKENFKHGFEWDNDHLSTNMFAHPYNGSLYYNAGRSNGFNFWQSELFAIGGSAMWELFMENEYPSTNDIIATPIGGAALGEVFYRASDLVLDDRTTGSERFGREVASFLISPMRGLTRIITGRAWERRSTTGRRFGTPPISVDFSLGTRILAYHGSDNLAKAGGIARINIDYGDKFADSSTTPYDYFSFLMELNAMKTQPFLSRIEIQGRLLSHEIVDSRKYHLSVGMYQHFDYFDSDTISTIGPDNPMEPCTVPYKLGTPASVGAGAMMRFIESRRSYIDAYFHFNGVILAGILSDYYRYYHRNYNWASGFSMKFGVKWTSSRNRLTISAADQFYRLYTWNGYDHYTDWSATPEGKPTNVQGDDSSATFNHFEVSVDYRLHHRFFATFGVDWYHRMTKYDYYTRLSETSWTNNPIVKSNQVGIQFMLTYKL